MNYAHVVQGGIMGTRVGAVSSGKTEVGITRIGYFLPMGTMVALIMIGSRLTHSYLINFLRNIYTRLLFHQQSN